MELSPPQMAEVRPRRPWGPESENVVVIKALAVPILLFELTAAPFKPLTFISMYG